MRSLSKGLVSILIRIPEYDVGNICSVRENLLQEEETVLIVLIAADYCNVLL